MFGEGDTARDMFKQSGFIEVRAEDRLQQFPTPPPRPNNGAPKATKKTEGKETKLISTDAPIGKPQPPVPKEARPAPVVECDLDGLKNNMALLRTVAGDIQYKLHGVDLSHGSFVVLYLKQSDIYFDPKQDAYYSLGIKLQTADSAGLFTSNVYYSGIAFDMPTETPTKALVFHLLV